MSIFKKAAAFLTAVGIACSCAACGYNTRTALTIDGVEVPAGVYIYYANSALNTALNKLSKENPDLDTSDMDAVRASTLEDKDVGTWIKDEATKSCTQFVEVEKKFDELGLELDEESQSSISMTMDYYWANSEEMMLKNGVSEDSFRKIVTSTYKNNMLYEHYYGIDGEEGITEQDVYDYYKENNIRCEYLTMDLKDGEGNLLKSDGKKEVMKLAESYKARLEKAKKADGIDGVKAEMDQIRKDYADYVASLSDDAASSDAEAETTEETTAADEDETTAKAETTAADEDETTAKAETTAAEADETTTKKAETTAADEDETTTNADEDAVATAAISETPHAEALTEAEETTTEDAETTGEDAETTAEDAETTAENAETTAENAETTAEDAETSEETADAETSEEAADEDAEEEADAEDASLLTAGNEDGSDAAAETDPFVNESIVSVIIPENYDDPDDIVYTPSEKVYQQLIKIDAKDYGTAYIVEDDEAYYLVTRYDIEERMNADDLWTDSTIDTTVFSMHSKDFEDMVDGWVDAAGVQRNEAAYKRYDPFKFDFT